MKLHHLSPAGLNAVTIHNDLTSFFEARCPKGSEAYHFSGLDDVKHQPQGLHFWVAKAQALSLLGVDKKEVAPDIRDAIQKQFPESVLSGRCVIGPKLSIKSCSTKSRTACHSKSKTEFGQRRTDIHR